MFHFRTFDVAHTPTALAPSGQICAGGLGAVVPGEALKPEIGARGRHAQALAYAAQRRRASQASRRLGNGVDATYWKAGVPAALARAASIRTTQGLARLP